MLAVTTESYLTMPSVIKLAGDFRMLGKEFVGYEQFDKIICTPEFSLGDYPLSDVLKDSIMQLPAWGVFNQHYIPQNMDTWK